SAGHVVALDLQTVGVDLDDLPLDEILAFRRAHLSDHRRYAIEVRRFVRDLSLLSQPERERELAARKQDIQDAAAALRGLSTKAWKRRAAFGLSIVGAAWTAKTGNPIGAALAVGGAIFGFQSTPVEAGAYSYLFRARQHA